MQIYIGYSFKVLHIALHNILPHFPISNLAFRMFDITSSHQVKPATPWSSQTKVNLKISAYSHKTFFLNKVRPRDWRTSNRFTVVLKLLGNFFPSVSLCRGGATALTQSPGLFYCRRRETSGFVTIITLIILKLQGTCKHCVGLPIHPDLGAPLLSFLKNSSSLPAI